MSLNNWRGRREDKEGEEKKKRKEKKRKGLPLILQSEITQR
jgi:hypothetical protein